MSVDRILEYISIFLALLIVLPIHEFAHAFAAVKFGDPTPKFQGRYTLNPMAHFDTMGIVCFVLLGFGWAKPVPINPSNFKKYKAGCFWTSIAGVLANYLLAFVAWPLFVLSLSIPQFGYFTDVLQIALYYCFSLSIVFFVFNLIPVYPLDGFRAISVYNKKRGNVYEFLRTKGIFVLYGLFALSLIADLTELYYLDILGMFINWATGILSVPITAFWGLIF